MSLETLLTAKQLAELLGTRTNTVYDLASAGELPSLKVPGVGRRFRESEVSAWLEGCRGRPSKPQEMREPDLGRAGSRDENDLHAEHTA
jgi:excisionase family DNA binding protein